MIEHPVLPSLHECEAGQFDWHFLNAASVFAPLAVGDEWLGKDWHKTIASFICLFVQTKVKEIRIRRARK